MQAIYEISQKTFCNKYIPHLSLAAAELLSREIFEEIEQSHQEALQDGQIWYTAIHKDEPAGKPLQM